MKNMLTIIIIVGDETEMISDCLKSCLFSDKIILVTTHATTKDTISIAKRIAPHIVITPAGKSVVDFSYWRNVGARQVDKGWILFVDADERITPDLQNEIMSFINEANNKCTNCDIPRLNYFLGHRVRHGNSYPDYVKRLFLKKSFKGYTGVLHEQPLVTGPTKTFKSGFLHFTHRDLNSMLSKTIRWTPIESQLLFSSSHPPIVWWRIVRMMFTKLWERLVTQSMWKDGVVGWISAIFESFDTYIIYSQLWELQQTSKS